MSRPPIPTELKKKHPRAAQNAKSAAELQFEKDKAAELDRLERALIPFLQANKRV